MKHNEKNIILKNLRILVLSLIFFFFFKWTKLQNIKMDFPLIISIMYNLTLPIFYKLRHIFNI